MYSNLKWLGLRTHWCHKSDNLTTLNSSLKIMFSLLLQWSRNITLKKMKIMYLTVWIHYLTVFSAYYNVSPISYYTLIKFTRSWNSCWRSFFPLYISALFCWKCSWTNRLVRHLIKDEKLSDIDVYTNLCKFFYFLPFIHQPIPNWDLVSLMCRLYVYDRKINNNINFRPKSDDSRFAS